MRVLVTGGGSLVARYLLRNRSSKLEWFLTSRRRVSGINSCEIIDLTDISKLRALLQRVRPDAVVNAAAEGSVDAVQRNPEAFVPLNVHVPRAIAEYCRRQQIPFIHISSNAVFGSERPPYADNSPYGPVNHYGELKRQAEVTVRSSYPEASILRPIQMYGWPRPGRRANLTSTWITCLRSGEPISVVDDVISEPLWAGDTADVILKLIARPLPGPTNLSGGEAVTLLNFAKLVAHEFDLDASLIRSVPSSSIRELAPRPHDTRFTLDRVRNELMVSPLGLEAGLLEMRREEWNGSRRGDYV